MALFEGVFFYDVCFGVLFGVAVFRFLFGVVSCVLGSDSIYFLFLFLMQFCFTGSAFGFFYF